MQVVTPVSRNLLKLTRFYKCYSPNEEGFTKQLQFQQLWSDVAPFGLYDPLNGGSLWSSTMTRFLYVR